jgi:cytochrome bd-type quinol oxidase subunit 2
VKLAPAVIPHGIPPAVVHSLIHPAPAVPAAAPAATSLIGGAGGWLGSGAAVIVIGLCWLAMKHMHHLHSVAHPWISRAVLAAMYCAGAALTLTPAGTFVIGLERDVLGWLGGVSTGLGWAAVTVATLFLAVSIAVALIWVPTTGFAAVAAGAPLVMALATGGIALQIYTATAYPAQQAVSAIAAWAGG